MSKIKKLLATHDVARDRIWAFVTKPNPPAEKLFAWVPRTDRRANKIMHSIDDAWVDFKNRVQVIELMHNILSGLPTS